MNAGPAIAVDFLDPASDTVAPASVLSAFGDIVAHGGGRRSRGGFAVETDGDEVTKGSESVRSAHVLQRRIWILAREEAQ